MVYLPRRSSDERCHNPTALNVSHADVWDASFLPPFPKQVQASAILPGCAYLRHSVAATIRDPDVGSVEGHSSWETPSRIGPDHRAGTGQQLGHIVVVLVRHPDVGPVEGCTGRRESDRVYANPRAGRADTVIWSAIRTLCNLADGVVRRDSPPTAGCRVHRNAGLVDNQHFAGSAGLSESAVASATIREASRSS